MRDKEPIGPDALAIVRPPLKHGLRHVVVIARDIGHCGAIWLGAKVNANLSGRSLISTVPRIDIVR
jgi:hypothetical protein